MTWSGLSVRRPVATTMAALIVVMLGLVALVGLRVDLLPDIERPTASVRTDYEGASPEVVERQVTEILEQIIATVPGVVELNSTSSQGRSDVRVEFAWGTSIDAAVQDLRARIEDEANELPEEIQRPNIRTFDVNSRPVVILGVSGDLDPVALTELVTEELAERFARVPGVAQVDPWGGYPREIRVALDPDRLRALAIPLDAVLSVIDDSNLDLPAGRIERGRFEVALRAPADYTSVESIGETVVAMRNGAPVTIGQLARIEDTHEELTRVVRVGEEQGLRVALRKQPSANTVDVAAAVLEEIDKLRRDMPHIHIVPVVNQGNFIEQSIRNVGWSVLYGGFFAVLILGYFLGDVRSTAVVSVAIPVSILGTFVLLYVGGFSLNLMTLGGLALGVGMMVDSAIVVVENIFFRRERGDDPVTAAIGGAQEVGPAIVASTVTTVVIFLPVVFMRGVAGQLFSELAYVIVFALAVSLVVSLTLVPMLTARIPVRIAAAAQPPEAKNEGRLLQAYGRVLDLALRYRAATVGLALLLLGASLGLFPWIGSELMPPTDEGEVRVTGEMQLGTRIAEVDRQTRRLERVVFDTVPEAVATVTTVRGGAVSEATGEVQIALGPTSSRDRSNAAVGSALRQALVGTVPGMDVRVRAPQGSMALNRVLGQTEEGITVEVRGDDLDALSALALRASALLAEVPGVTDVVDTRPEGVPEERFRIDRAKVADLGLVVRDVASVLEVAVAGRQAGMYRDGGQAHRIFVQLADVRQRSLDDILDMTLTTPDGAQVPLRHLVDVSPGYGPMAIARRARRRLVTVTANVADRPMGDVAEDILEALEGIPRPEGTSFKISGAYEVQQETFAELQVGVWLALVLVYMVLASQYESFRDPLVVMVSVPFAAVGVLLALFLTGTTFNVQSGMGVVMLGGIVVNNAILVVDLAGRLRDQEGLSPVEAARTAGRRRVRPILMTTLTTLLGLMPLALGIGEGADAQAPLARAVVGGLAASTVLSLVLIPVVYTFVHREPSRA